jgi:hypothetical protein
MWMTGLNFITILCIKDHPREDQYSYPGGVNNFFG